MRHRKAGIKLNRTSSHRQAMFRNMVTSLLKHERIRTTDAKAKELRRWADNLITLAKRGDLHARRQALAIVQEKAVVHKLFEEAPKRFGNVDGGYTRVVKLTRRPGDAALVSLVELVTADTEKKKPRKKAKADDKAAPEETAGAPDADEAATEATADQSDDQEAADDSEPTVDDDRSDESMETASAEAHEEAAVKDPAEDPGKAATDAEESAAMETEPGTDGEKAEDASDPDTEEPKK